MNLANKITMSRVLMIPICVVTLLINNSLFRWISAIIFVIACLTDALDGYVARSQNMITNFGKFMDPLVDKLLVCSVLIALVELKNISCWAVIIIICREFIVTGFRLIAVDNDLVIPANNLGKIKTILQMIMTVFVILNFGSPFALAVKYILIYSAVIMTIVSGVDYILKNKSVLKN